MEPNRPLSPHFGKVVNGDGAATKLPRRLPLSLLLYSPGHDKGEMVKTGMDACLKCEVLACPVPGTLAIDVITRCTVCGLQSKRVYPPKG